MKGVDQLIPEFLAMCLAGGNELGVFALFKLAGPLPVLTIQTQAMLEIPFQHGRKQLKSAIRSTTCQLVDDVELKIVIVNT